VATDVVMPALGVAQETGKLVRWLKAEGDRVMAGEPLMEVETDKVTVEIEAPAEGVLSRVRISEGEEVPVGEVIALIVAPGEAAPGGDGGEPAPSRPERGIPGRSPASPLARRRAKEAGIDLSTLEGTGPGGAVTVADIEAAGATRAATAPSAEAAVGEEAVPVGTVWRRMAERTSGSWTTAPHFFLFREADAGRLVSWQRDLEGQGTVTTYTDLLVKLVASALREHPAVNARWEDGGLVRSKDVNVGIAVATDDGLVVPVIHGADRLAVIEIATRRSDLVSRARERALRPQDVAGGTFTVSNLGMYGIDAFTAVLNPPQAAILAVGRIAERVVARDGRPEVRPVLWLSLSCDHRALDGARGARFLETLASLIEEPSSLMQ
jgi:pyruvate dehydrogenase E2 component (dihydrolipoamide acetyltransferase)